jgi:Prp8 binding protein
MATMMTEGPPQKRSRGSDGGAVVPYHQQQQQQPLRSSSLPSPTLQLTGHTGSVYAVEYSPSGQTLLSTSFDKKCLLWSHGSGAGGGEDSDYGLGETSSGNYENYNVLEGHKNAVLDCAWLDEDNVVTASADKTVQLWDALTGTRLRKWQEHTGIVNAVSTSATAENNSNNNMVFSVSDDGSCMHWDRRQKSSVGCLSTDYPVLAVAAGHAGNHVYTAGIDHKITCWDVGMQRPVYSMKGHADTVTSLAMNHAGTHLLSNSMDQTVRQWDIQSFVVGNRLVKTYQGHKHNAERGLLKCSWSPTGNMVSAGSADKMVHIWDEFSTEELYLLPGHKGCVNAVAFHPTENVIASAGSDKKIFVGELS